MVSKVSKVKYAKIFGNHFWKPLSSFYYTLFSLYNILIYNNIERKNKDSKHALFALVSKVSKNIRSLKGVYRGGEELRQSRTLRESF